MADILIDLYQQYGDFPNRQELIAEFLGVSQPTVSQWIKILRLEFKTVLLKPEAEGGEPEPQP
jgi:hypothetical protein